MYDPVTHGSGGSSALSHRRMLIRKSLKSVVDTEGLFNGLKGGQQFYLRHQIPRARLIRYGTSANGPIDLSVQIVQNVQPLRSVQAV
jgi:hypothetical protein